MALRKLVKSYKRRVKKPKQKKQLKLKTKKVILRMMMMTSTSSAVMTLFHLPRSRLILTTMISA